MSAPRSAAVAAPPIVRTASSHPRILILYAAIGEGHRSAANALESVFSELLPDARIRNADALEFASPRFAAFYRESYLSMISRAPHLLGFFYDLLDVPLKNGKNVFDAVKLKIERSQTKRLQELLMSEPWDMVINTHFLPAAITAALKAEGKINALHFCVTTDFIAHRIWMNDPCDQYFAATQAGKNHLVRRGIPEDRVIVSGIPVKPSFLRRVEKNECKELLGLDPELPLLLQLGGGIGTGPMDQIYARLLEVEIPCQIAAIAGRNAAAKAAMEKIDVPARHRATVVGFTDQMHEWMAASDLIITKPGGLTVSEALACARPMALVTPVPGQEAHNCDYLLENGAAVKVSALPTLSEKVSNLLSEPWKLAEMQRRAAYLAKPRAAFTIAEEILVQYRSSKPL